MRWLLVVRRHGSVLIIKFGNAVGQLCT